MTDARPQPESIPEITPPPLILGPEDELPPDGPVADEPYVPPTPGEYLPDPPMPEE